MSEDINKTFYVGLYAITGSAILLFIAYVAAVLETSIITTILGILMILCICALAYSTLRGLVYILHPKAYGLRNGKRKCKLFHVGYNPNGMFEVQYIDASNSKVRVANLVSTDDGSVDFVYGKALTKGRPTECLSVTEEWDREWGCATESLTEDLNSRQL